jgi:23S rRNA G2069 N7-methylase RlmK/C1962 C5-methylase RlmI
MSQSGQFENVVAEAAKSAKRHISLMRHAGAAGDHPLHFSYYNDKYLTNLTYIVY